MALMASQNVQYSIQYTGDVVSEAEAGGGSVVTGRGSEGGGGSASGSRFSGFSLNVRARFTGSLAVASSLSGRTGAGDGADEAAAGFVFSADDSGASTKRRRRFSDRLLVSFSFDEEEEAAADASESCFLLHKLQTIHTLCICT